MASFFFQGKRIEYSEAGNGPATLVFLHGLGSTRLAWKEQARFFSKNYKILRIDLLGHGASSKNVQPRFAIRNNARIVERLLATLDRPYVIVAHSWAGSVVARMRLQSLGLLAGIVFVDCTRIDRYAIHAYHEFAESFLTKTPGELRVASMQWYRELIGSNKKPIERDLVRPLVKHDLKQIFRIAKAIEKTPRLKSANVPILVCEADQFFGTKRFEDWSFRKIFRKADYLLLPNTKHFFFRTHPRRFNKILRQFLNKRVQVSKFAKS